LAAVLMSLTTGCCASGGWFGKAAEWTSESAVKKLGREAIVKDPLVRRYWAVEIIDPALNRPPELEGMDEGNQEGHTPS